MNQISLSLLVEIWRKDCAYQKCVVGNIYRLPSYLSADLRSFTNEVTNLLNILRTRSKFVYICGNYYYFFFLGVNMWRL